MYLEIGDYGVIGNGRTAALVGTNGAIDWCCFPDFHSPSVFGAILDDDSGGRFAVDLVGGATTEQSYDAKTNVLETTFESDSGVVRLHDFMPQYMESGTLRQENELVRIVECESGAPTVRIEFDPQFDYARGETSLEAIEDGWLASQGEQTLSLVASAPIAVDGTRGTVDLTAGETLFLVSRFDDPDPNPVDADALTEKLEWTRDYWRRWAERADYDGPWADYVRRSALVLKLLAYEETGAIVAAATTSLPEMPGGARNWDYRFSWLRDAIFSAWSLHQLDYHELGIEFLALLESKLDPSDIPPLVDVYGDVVGGEEELDHLEGYRGNGPVRIGNGAAQQDQWDSYGAMIDGIYFSHRTLGGIDPILYEEFVKPAVDHVCEVWDEPDHGIWEVRGEKQHFTTSKVWSWVALDRGIKIAEGEGFREDAKRWKPIREEIKREVLERSWSEEVGAFTMAYDVDALDASVLLLPLVRFLPADHPKMERTIHAIRDGLGEDSLLYRYRPEEVFSDPIESDDAAFTTCSFWLVACLARLGRVSEAEDLFESLLEYSNHLGLYAEELDTETGEQLGNVPQAYVHMGLINAAVEIQLDADS